jgi:hypothetical protein
MLTLSGILAVVGLPLGVLVVLLRLATRSERRRAARIACQVAVTDAIHQELGAVVAPVVESTSGGYQLVIPLSADSVPMMGPVLAAARRGLERFDEEAAARTPIVLVSRPVTAFGERMAA